jgi:hypothetical protein
MQGGKPWDRIKFAPKNVSSPRRWNDAPKEQLQVKRYGPYKAITNPDYLADALAKRVALGERGCNPVIQVTRFRDFAHRSMFVPASNI